MGELEPRWSRRHKGRGRRLGYDLRLFAPLVAIALCVAGSATAILAVERAAPDALAKAGSEALAKTGSEGLAPGADLGSDCRPRATALR
ncbi:MAG: hypothetical protein AAGC67_16105 [Myxococcota bacterium]